MLLFQRLPFEGKLLTRYESHFFLQYVDKLTRFWWAQHWRSYIGLLPRTRLIYPFTSEPYGKHWSFSLCASLSLITHCIDTHSLGEAVSEIGHNKKFWKYWHTDGQLLTTNTLTIDDHCEPTTWWNPFRGPFWFKARVKLTWKCRAKSWSAYQNVLTLFNCIAYK